MLKHRLPNLIVLVLAIAIALLVVDRVAFELLTLAGPELRRSADTPRDVEWWTSNVGSFQQAFDELPPPIGMKGRDGTWFHRSGGEAGPGPNGGDVWSDSGIGVMTLDYPSPLIQGRALFTNETWAYHVGVALPLVFLDRTYVGKAGIDPGHPAEGWRWDFHFVPFALNVLIWLVLADYMFIWLGRIRRSFRSGGNRCASCGYDLRGNASGVCPECGTAAPLALAARARERGRG